MSDTMLHGVLNMPPELWGDDFLDKMQRYDRYLQASKRITEDEEKLERLNKVLAAAKNLRDVKGRYHSEQAYQALLDTLKAIGE